MSRDEADTTDASHDTDGRTRRAFMSAAAAVGSVALAGCSGDGGGGNPTMTEESTPMMTETPTETPTATPEPTNANVPVLNYALTLEHLENAFYREALSEFADDELMNADVLSGFDEGVRRDVPAFLEAAGDHEAAHVDAIAATVSDLGGDPVAEGEYDFGYETPSEFLRTAAAIENTGVAAYAGAAPDIANNEVLSAAAGIHSVEARHAAFLNLITGSAPYPRAVDEAKSMEEVFEIAGQFITEGGSTPDYGEVADPTPDRKRDDGTTDVDVLNYALTLEHLENAFYREGLETFADDELMNADVLMEYGEGLRRSVPDWLRTAGDHEAAHVDAIAATVSDLGGDPVSEATYDFGYETPSEFLGVAQSLENVGVSAYAGAAGTVANDQVFAAALGIHSVEARHAAVLNELNVESPFPAAVDEPRTMAEVREIAGQFIVEG